MTRQQEAVRYCSERWRCRWHSEWWLHRVVVVVVRSEWWLHGLPMM
jgi:hypothetical protein